MRFFGMQIAVTVLVVLLYRKLGKSFSLAQWVLTNGKLFFFFPSLVSILEQNTEQKNKSKKSNSQSLEFISSKLNFTVESLREVKLIKEKLSYSFLAKTDHFEDFTTQIDACFLTFLVALLTQLLFYVSPSTEETQLNLALFWLLGLLLNLVYRSTKLLLIYFTEALSHEWSLCILFGLIYFLLSIVVVNIPSTREELNLGDLEASFFSILKDLNFTNNTSELEISYASHVRTVISLFAAFIGMLLLFPSNRVAICHNRCIQMCNRSFLGYLWYQLVFWLPIFPCTFWIPIAGREMLVGGSHGVVNLETFLFIRSLSFPIVVCIRFSSCFAYIQAFLERPNDILCSLQAKNSRINAILLYSTLLLPNSYTSVVAIHCSLLPCLILCFGLAAWFLAAFSTATYTFLFHTCIFYSWWCCLASMSSSVLSLFYQNYIESKD